MNFKGVLAALLTGIMFFIILQVCGSVERPKPLDANTPEQLGKKSTVKLTYWIWDNTNNTESDLIDYFNKSQQDIQVEYEVVSSDNFHDKLLVSVNAGNPPDICPLMDSWVSEFVQMGALVDVKDMLENWDQKENMFENVWKLCEPEQGGPIYTIPHTNLPLYLYCRKDLFDKEGLKLPETMDEFYDACEKLTKDTDGDGKIDQYGFSFRGARGGNDMWSTFLMSDIGGEFVDEKGRTRFNTPETIAANERYLGLYKNKFAPPSAPKDGLAEISQAFESGTTAMLVHHVITSKKWEQRFGDKVVAIPLPKGKSGRWAVNTPTHNAVFKASRNPKEALKFNLWFTRPDINDKFCKQMGMVPINKKTAEDKYYREDKYMKVAIESVKDSHVFPANPKLAMWNEKVWPETMQRALFGEISSKEMLDILEKAMN